MPQMPSMKRPASPTPTPTPGPESPLPSTISLPKNNKKRKPNPSESPSKLDAGSPAPDVFGAVGDGEEDAAPLSEYDLTRMAKRHVPRFPAFQPVAEGSEWNNTADIPANRLGFRYILAGCAGPASKTVDKTMESLPQQLRFSWEDRSPYVRVTTDGLSMTTEKGFRSARCNVPVREGKWYMEVEILKGGGEGKGEAAGRLDGAHVRLGWGRREAPLNGPVGMDGYSYGVRDATGERVTLSRPRPYGQPFRTGDVVGMYISLPPRRQPNPKDSHDPARLVRKRIPIQFKGQVYFESVEYPQNKEMQSLLDYSGKTIAAVNAKKGPAKGPPGRKEQAVGPIMRPLPTLQGSVIAFFVNGKPQGIAFRDIYDFLQLPLNNAAPKAKEHRPSGMAAIMKERENNFDDGSLGYYPFVSVFNDAQVRINPGPNFKYPPPADIDAKLGLPPSSKFGEPTWRPMSERYHEYMSEVWAQDAIEAVELNAEAERIAKDIEKEKAEEAKREEKRRRDRERTALKKKERENIKLGSKPKDASTPRDSIVPNSPAGRESTLPPKLENPDDVEDVLLSLVETPRTEGKTEDLDDELLEAAEGGGRKSTAPDDIDEELLEAAGTPQRGSSRPRKSEDIDDELLEAAGSAKPIKQPKSEDIDDVLLEVARSVDRKSSVSRESEDIDDEILEVAALSMPKSKSPKVSRVDDWDEDDDELLAAVASDTRPVDRASSSSMIGDLEEEDDDLDLLAAVSSDSRLPKSRKAKLPPPDIDLSDDELLLGALKPSDHKSHKSRRMNDIDDDLLEVANVTDRRSSKGRKPRAGSLADDLLEAISSPNGKPKKISKVRDWVDEDDVDDNILDALVITKTKKSSKPHSSSSSRSKSRKVEDSDDDLLEAIVPSGPPLTLKVPATARGARHHSADFSDSEDEEIRASTTRDPVDDLIADAMDED